MLVVTDHIMFSCGWDCLHSRCQTQLQCLRLCCGCTLLFLGLWQKHLIFRNVCSISLEQCQLKPLSIHTELNHFWDIFASKDIGKTNLSCLSVVDFQCIFLLSFSYFYRNVSWPMKNYNLNLDKCICVITKTPYNWNEKNVLWVW